MYLFSSLRLLPLLPFFFFFFTDTATTEIYTLSLHDDLPICAGHAVLFDFASLEHELVPLAAGRSEEHTSELQSRLHLGCRLLLEKKKRQRHWEKELSCRGTAYEWRGRRLI